MTSSVVTAHQLTKHYPGHKAVKGINFDITEGKCFGFLGPNGAGKTTTLSMLMGITPVTNGELTVLGLRIPDNSREIRQRLGIVPQEDNLDPDFSVENNLSLYASYFGIDKKIIQQRIPELLDFASLTEKAKVKTDTLSGGMKRRLTIARALVNDPDILILDEPTTGLDPQARHVIWAKLTELKQQGKTLILTTHYMEEAERLCDELVIMDQGKILEQGSPAELIHKHVEPEVIEIRGKDDLEKIANVELDCRQEKVGNSLYCYVDKQSDVLTTLKEIHALAFIHRPAGLEDVFLKLTGRDLRD